MCLALMAHSVSIPSTMPKLAHVERSHGEATHRSEIPAIVSITTGTVSGDASRCFLLQVTESPQLLSPSK